MDIAGGYNDYRAQYAFLLLLSMFMTRQSYVGLGFAAVSRDDVRLLKRLLREGHIDHVYQDSRGKSLLMAAANAHSRRCTNHLLEVGADPNQTDLECRHALLYACEVIGAVHVVDLLIRSGAVVNHADKSGRTALMEAACTGDSEALALLLAHGTQVNDVTYMGETALTFGIVWGHHDVVRVLLENGADVSSCLGQWQPIEYAEQSGDKEMIAILRQALGRSQTK